MFSPLGLTGLLNVKKKDYESLAFQQECPAEVLHKSPKRPPQALSKPLQGSGKDRGSCIDCLGWDPGNTTGPRQVLVFHQFHADISEIRHFI